MIMETAFPTRTVTVWETAPEDRLTWGEVFLLVIAAVAAFAFTVAIVETLLGVR